MVLEKPPYLKVLWGMIRINGSISLDGKDMGKLAAHEIPKLGVGYVPQGRRLFSELTVKENLTVALLANSTLRDIPETLFDLFPVLKKRLNQTSGTLSGGEQQMLAMARAYCLSPSLLLLDEPTEGLMPSMIDAIRKIIIRLKSQGVAILLVEQRVEAVLSIVDNVAFIENGVLKKQLSAEELRNDLALLNQYIGVY